MSTSPLRAIILAPTEKDGQLTRRIFDRHEIDWAFAPTVKKACELLDAGASLFLVAEEAIANDAELAVWLTKQPAWSDLPVLVMARPGADSFDLTRISQTHGNVTVLERPMRVSGLVSAARSAIRARQRQYQIRDYLRDHEDAETELRANDRRKDEFLAILAHELRNPLAPISNALDILKLSQHADAQVARVGQMMERQIGNLKRLVEDLLEVSRITRGEAELKKAPADLSAILSTAIEASLPLFETGGVTLDAVLLSRAITLDADAVRLSQVFTNVLNNAAKYTQRGGRVTLRVEEADAAIEVRIKDDGAGIPFDMQSSIFELFTQVDQHLDRAQGGLGIGLTLVKRLVHLHDGNVRVISEGLGKGSEFVIALPLGHGIEPRHGLVPPATIEDPLTGMQILIVDDNQDAADSLSMLLEMLGAAVTVAYTGIAGLQHLEQFETDVAILDVGMQGMDGLTLARRIKAQPALSAITLIALTGFGQPQHREATKLAGFDVHLVKPVSIDALEIILGERLKQA